jgi:cell division protease FtsH
MVSIFGMSDKVGTVSFYDSSGQNDYAFTKPYSEKTAELIDQEAKAIIDGQYKRAVELLREQGEGHKKLAQLLLEREVIFSEDLEHIFGKRKWGKHEEESKSEEIKNTTVSENAEPQAS